MELYFDRWQQKQIDHCYTAHKIGGDNATSTTDFEKSEGFKTIWAENLEEAIRLVGGGDA